MKPIRPSARARVALALLLLPACGSSDDGPEGAGGGIQAGLDITLAGGVVHGATTAGGRAFLGIPFAAPPARFAAPEAAPPFGDHDATVAGPDCFQHLRLGTQVLEGSSEDCLTLNVWAPTEAPAAPLPVMVWIHGGGFELGSGHAGGAYAADRWLAQAPVVMVTVNYRLGPFGFMAHEALSAEDARGTSGNRGIEDQRLALQWVQENILAFGGDANNVTVFGESAGGISLCAHLVSPQSRGLFHRAILQSGPCEGAMDDLASAEQQGAALAEAVGCAGADVVACLRERPAEQILGALPTNAAFLFGDGVRWSPHVDGVVIPGSPLDLMAAGDAADVPMILGTTADEGTLFIALSGLKQIDAAGYEAAVRDALASPAAAEQILERYPADDFPTPADALATVVNDGVFACTTRRAARAMANGAPTFLFHYTYAMPSVLGDLGAFHGSDLPVLWGRDPFGLGDPPPESEPLGVAMRDLWLTFARDGAPGGDWAPHDAAGDRHYRLDLQPQSDTGLLAAACDFWDGVDTSR